MAASAHHSPAGAGGRYDAARRRRGKRAGRERGCWLYIPAVELEAAGVDTSSDPPYYRVWSDSRGGLVVRLYREP